MWYFVQTVLGIIFRHPVTGTSIIPILPDGRVVLVQKRGSGKWAFPGGMVDWGEDITQAVTRELAEETGLELVKITRLVGVYSSPQRDRRVHSICIAVAAEVRGEMQVSDINEIMAVRDVAIADLAEIQLANDHNRQLQDYLQNLTVVA